MAKAVIHHIPVCPFSQRLEILLELKGQRSAVDFRVVDITKPRDPELLHKTRGVTALPVLETDQGLILRESLVLMRYLDDLLEPRIARKDALEHALENFLISFEREFVSAGYTLVLNQDPARREALYEKLLGEYRKLNTFLVDYARGAEFLSEDFGYAEVAFTSMFVRFAFLDYYERFELPAGAEYDRVRTWRSACLSHPAAQQVSAEEVVKLYYDYAKGIGNGGLLPGRTRSSFSFEPHWSKRPWPPRDKYAVSATDAELGQV